MMTCYISTRTTRQMKKLDRGCKEVVMYFDIYKSLIDLCSSVAGLKIDECTVAMCSLCCLPVHIEVCSFHAVPSPQ